MMMADKNKKGIAIILSKMKGEKEMPKEEPREEEGEMGEESAAEEMLRAIEAKDSKALVEAMKAFYEMCASKEEEY